MTHNEIVKTRFAPSPTGFLHVGGARTALFCYLQARRYGGTFVLRIEDTDRERSTEESVAAILLGMSWLGLDYDEGPYYQSERFDRYREVVDWLMGQGKAYRCYCTKEELDAMREEQLARKETPRYDGRCRHRTKPREGVDPVVRFGSPDEGTVEFEDRVHGRQRVWAWDLDDLVIMRADGTPTYNFTVVVDDIDMGITEVIRGDDHLKNTPRQIQIYDALGVRPPAFAHVPMILGPDGSRLSKRHGAVSVTQYREQGYLPEALINYLVRLGWSHGDQEIFSRQEMIDLFDIRDVNKAAASFDQDKLDWLNHHYIKTLDPAYVAQHLTHQLDHHWGFDLGQGPDLVALVQAQRERAKTLAEMAERSVYFFRDFDAIDESAGKKHLRPVVAEPMRMVRERLAALTEWSAEDINGVIQATADELEQKFGKVAQPLRVAVAGGPVSPPIDQTLALAGRERSLRRIDAALALIAERAEA